MSMTREHRNSARGQTPAVVSATRAKAGVTGHNVRYVLIFGLLGVIAAFALVYIYFFSA